MKKQYIKPEVDIFHAEVVILAGSTDGDINLPLNPDIEDEGYAD